MATQPHKETAKEKEEREDEEKEQREKEGRKDYNAPVTSPNAKGKHDTELLQGKEVPLEEQGRVNESREWIAAEAERQEKADIDRFKAERSHAARKAAVESASKGGS